MSKENLYRLPGYQHGDHQEVYKRIRERYPSLKVSYWTVVYHMKTPLSSGPVRDIVITTYQQWVIYRDQHPNKPRDMRLKRIHFPKTIKR